MATRTIRLVTPLLVALFAALGVVAPVLGASDRQTRASDEVRAAASCCGDDCQCGASCPCITRDRSGESSDTPLAPIDLRTPRSLCLAAPATMERVALVDSDAARLRTSTASAEPRCRPAGRELLARVSKWTT